METPLSPEQLEPIRQALLSGNKIEAIKLYRGATNTGLAEAKHAVEALEILWRASTPATPGNPGTPFSKPAKGCLGLVVLGGAGLWSVVHLFFP